ncbi:hypothetical protein DFH09DRAFT_1093726 [Mycena vulgaris]|nr:hypothetical protein DFH09DRAFT_1093726 [Mycena vulgaris]
MLWERHGEGTDPTRVMVLKIEMKREPRSGGDWEKASAATEKSGELGVRRWEGKYVDRAPDPIPCYAAVEVPRRDRLRTPVAPPLRASPSFLRAPIHAGRPHPVEPPCLREKAELLDSERALVAQDVLRMAFRTSRLSGELHSIQCLVAVMKNQRRRRWLVKNAPESWRHRGRNPKDEVQVLASSHPSVLAQGLLLDNGELPILPACGAAQATNLTRHHKLLVPAIHEAIFSTLQ